MARYLSRSGFILNTLRSNTRYTTCQIPYRLISNISSKTLTAPDENPSASSEKLRHWSEIPGPKSYPFIGSLWSIIFSKHYDKRRLYLFWQEFIKRYGPIVHLHGPGLNNTVFLKKPEDIETMYRVTMHNPIRPGFLSVKSVRQNSPNDFFQNKTGILAEQGDEWWRVRSKVQKHMLKPKSVSTYLNQIDDIALELVEKIASIRDKTNEVPPTFIMELYKWSLESISVIALDRRLGCMDPKVTEDSIQMRLIHEINTVFDALNLTEMGLKLWKILPMPSYRKLQNAHNAFLELAIKSINESEEQFKLKSDKDEASLMETLLNMPGLSKADVATIVLDMLFAGVDTTSHSLAFTLYCLARNPDKQKLVQEEIDSIIKDRNEPISAKHLGQLNYTKAVLKETFRLFPLVQGTIRELDQDAVFSGYLVPKGWHVVSLNQLAAWDEENFPKADEFIPERWLRHQPLGPIHAYASLPFSTGTRMCIGRRIAEQELHTAITRIFQHYTVEYKYKDFYPVSKLVFAPSEPLKFNFIDRK